MIRQIASEETRACKVVKNRIGNIEYDCIGGEYTLRSMSWENEARPLAMLADRCSVQVNGEVLMQIGMWDVLKEISKHVLARYTACRNFWLTCSCTRLEFGLILTSRHLDQGRFRTWGWIKYWRASYRQKGYSVVHPESENTEKDVSISKSRFDI